MRAQKHTGLFEYQEAAIDYVVARMEREDFPWIEAVILFGSCARGENRFDSDVDILFATNNHYREYKDQMLDLKRELIGLDDIYAEVDPKFFTKNDVNEGKSTFLQNVRRDGIVLWKRNHSCPNDRKDA